MAKNRFTIANKPEHTSPTLDSLLLEIMREEFPDDPNFKAGILTDDVEPNQELIDQVTLPEFESTSRNSRQVLQVSPSVVQHTNYQLTKTIPTVDEDILDDLLDEEWNFFLDDVTEYQPGVSNLFLIHPDQLKEPVDYHDAYIQAGPQNLGSFDSVNDIFCVYFIRNDVAYPIPNYKTLEVMLVERRLTYRDITIADSTQLQQFDLSMDGKTSITDEVVSPEAEFAARSLFDRSAEWNFRIRYESGYRPLSPFVRDPGEYIDPVSRKYFNAVYSKQTYQESLRSRFEGKMVILSWPPSSLTDEEFNSEVIQNDNNQLNDLVNGVRIMTNGYWKQVTDGEVFRSYAYVNDLDVSGYQDPNGRYGRAGYINLLIQNGGITVLSGEDVVDAREGLDPVWNEFAHIIEADRMDIDEYKDYVDSYSNNPFDVDYLQPYEPRGSVKYYDQDTLNILREQSIEQSLINNLVDSINTRYEEVASIVANAAVMLNSTPTVLANVLDEIENDIIQIGVSEDKWKFVKFKNNGNINVKGSEYSLLKLVEKNQRITLQLSDAQEDEIAGEWSRVVTSDTLSLPEAVVEDIPGNAGNPSSFALPRDNNGRDRPSMKSNAYMRASMLAAFYYKWDVAGDDVNSGTRDIVKELAEGIDNTRLAAANQFDSFFSQFSDITNAIATSDTVEQFQEILNTLNNIRSSYIAYEQSVDAVNDFVFTLRSNTKAYVNNVYESIELLRKRIYNGVGNGNKFAILWTANAREIIEKYSPGKKFTNYQKSEG